MTFHVIRHSGRRENIASPAARFAAEVVVGWWHWRFASVELEGVIESPSHVASLCFG